MKVRRLEAEEYEQLKEIAEGAVPDPIRTSVGVVTDGEKLVARIFVVAPIHVEGPWIDPEYRNGTLASRLMGWAEQEAKRYGSKRLFAYGFSAELEGYLERLGFRKQPVTVWTKEI